MKPSEQIEQFCYGVLSALLVVGLICMMWWSA